MPVFHSRYNDATGVHTVCGCPLLPLKTRVRGPAPAPQPGEQVVDLVDEALRSFRWNILFKNFEVLGDADRVLVYVTLWIQKCISVASQASGRDEAARQLEAMAAAEMPGPGEPAFILNQLFKPGGDQDIQTAKAYLKQLRQESLVRLMPVLYPSGQPDKWWFQFSKKKFMNIQL
eukprot:TRINITY_DN7835_c0_g1_i1.p1 TRINITY_DN7835_c0_g1~~TRINITY_DN7835_c0_g1_i1.p1  ORF type:complete len:175 (+),score=34.23 TRINITY_DN7835_c0_g1_i1:54-578(+)